MTQTNLVKAGLMAEQQPAYDISRIYRANHPDVELAFKAPIVEKSQPVDFTAHPTALDTLQPLTMAPRAL